MAAVNAAQMDWLKQGNPNPDGAFFAVSETVPFLPWTSGGSNKAISNALVKSATGSEGTSALNTFWWNNARTGYRCIWGNASTDTTETFKQFLSDNNVVFCGELATPITITLTPGTLSALQGANCVWIDGATGAITAQYPCDTKLYIDKKIAEILNAA